MRLSEKETTLIEKREKLIGMWRYAGPASLLLVLALAGWLFFSSPLLANPFHVMARLEAGTIPKTSLVLMAGMLPVLTLAVLGILLALIGFVWISIRRELAYIEIIKRLRDNGTESRD